MPLSTDVRLPRAATPNFPDRCFVCDRERPGDVLRLTVRRAGAWDLVLPWLWFVRRPVRIAVPACPPCREGAVRQRRSRTLVLLTCIAVAAAFVFPLVKSWGLSRGWSRLAVLALCALPAVPWVLWITLRPPPIDLTVRGDTVDYEFADADYATDFRAANDGDLV